MEQRLRDYIENLFKSAPKTKQAYELKEEIVVNTIERYHDLLLEGKSEGDAYNFAIAGIGDINELLEAFGGRPEKEQQFTDEQLETIRGRSSLFKGIAVALYILCVTPCIFLSMTPLVAVSPVFMFFMISVATGLLIYSKATKFVPVMTDEKETAKIKRNAVMRSVAVGMYISCVTPCIFLAETPIVVISPVFMFLIIAIATVLIILSKGGKTYSKTNNTIAGNFNDWNRKEGSTSILYKILVAILWITACFVYIFVTSTTGLFAVSVTWIIFLIAVALQNLMKAIFDYLEARK